LKKHYPEYTIGFSDHTIGISAPIVAVGMGAEIIEKHITIDRRMKGTDQAGSLGPEGVMRMVRDIRITERWMGKEEFFIEPSVEGARIKLERSVAAKRDLNLGDVVTENDIHLLSPGDGIKWVDRDQLIGATIIKKVPKNEIIYLDHVKNN
jgi:sialic acid synthase